MSVVLPSQHDRIAESGLPLSRPCPLCDRDAVLMVAANGNAAYYCAECTLHFSLGKNGALEARW